jgi:serine/threonine protein phosphatase PrpC
VLITKDYIYCANAGDTRAIITKKKGADGKIETV